MTWLLALYPPRWRRRYGDELRALIGSQPFSVHAVIDLIAGAIDAWLEPQKFPVTMAPAGAEQGATMIRTMLKLGCAGSRGPVSREDARKSAAVNLGGTLLLTAFWMTLRIRLANHNYVDGFLAMAYLVPYLFSLRYTSLKGRSLRTQSIFIGGMILVLTLILGTAGWLASRI
jgi:Ca2+/Na+ antiporter